MSGQIYKRTTALMEAEIGEELVALDARQGTCFGFNEVATAVWRRLAEPATFEQLRTGLLADYEVGEKQCTVELRLLLDQLLQARLIEIGE